MKGSILAARKADAVARIAAETKRLGGSFAPPAARGDVEHQQLALLEAIGEALAGLDSVGEVLETVAVEEEAASGQLSVASEETAADDRPPTADEDEEASPPPPAKGKSGAAAGKAPAKGRGGKERGL